MSHVTKFATKTAFRDSGLLVEALQGLGTITTNIKDYYNKEIPCAIGIQTREFPRGFGFVRNEKTGAMEVKGDTYGYGRQAETLLKQIETRYQTLGVQMILKRHNFNITGTQQSGNNTTRLMARRY